VYISGKKNLPSTPLYGENWLMNFEAKSMTRGKRKRRKYDRGSKEDKRQRGKRRSTVK
jgi:hypothetical protein